MNLSATIRNAGGELTRRGSAIDSRAYGFLFRDLRLTPWKPAGPAPEEDRIFELSERLFKVKSAPNPKIPAGYTFFGQFITHDLTFALPPFGRRINQRTPRFDLDCVYAGGPESHPLLYELRDPRRLLIGRNRSGEFDLPRNADTSLDRGMTGTFDTRRRALIGDPRNDENTIISQLHLAFLQFHNRLAADRTFEDAQRIARWAYQHAALHFLRLVCGRDLVDDVLGRGGRPNLKYFKMDTSSRVLIPVEFSFAAFRMGHSMLGESYHLSDALQADREDHPFDLFAHGSPDWSERNKQAHNMLEGQRELPKRWTVQWDRFVGSSSGTQPSQRIDTHLAAPLRTLPLHPSPGARDDRERSLAYRTLYSGWRQTLASGQRIAALLGCKPLDLDPIAEGAEDPLFVYVLREAEENETAELGPVGARIVAEVFVGLLHADAESFYHLAPDWQPWDELGIRVDTELTLEHLLRFAEVPITRQDWEAYVPASAQRP